MAHRSLVALLALSFAFVLPAAAQEDDGGSRLELGVQGGGILLDEGGNQLLGGGRAGLRFGNGIGIGVTGHRTTRSVDLPDGDSEDATTWLYDAEISWEVPSESRANFVASVGVGQVRFEPTDSEEAEGTDTTTETTIPLGLGYRWYNYDGNHPWALRFDFRDYIFLIEGEDGEDDAVANNYAFTLGLELFLGSTP